MPQIICPITGNVCPYSGCALNWCHLNNFPIPKKQEPQSEQPPTNKVEPEQWKVADIKIYGRPISDFLLPDQLEFINQFITPLQSENKVLQDNIKKLFEWYQSKIEELKGEVEEKEKVVKSKHAVIEMYRKELCKISSLESENSKLITGLESVRENLNLENYPEADFVAREALSK